MNRKRTTDRSRRRTESRWSETASSGSTDRGQTTQDFAVGIGVFLLAIAFVFSFLPTIMMPFDSSISGAETAQADRIAGLIVDDESTEMANELNLSEFNYTEDDLTAEVGLRRTNGNTVDQVNVTVEDLDGNVVSDDWTGGATYDNQSAASSARIITTTNDTTCDPACRLIVRVW